MKLNLCKAIIVCLAAVSAQAATATPAPADSAAVVNARAIREDVQARQKDRAEEQRVDAPAAAAPGAPLVLPVDETDSPGATK